MRSRTSLLGQPGQETCRNPLAFHIGLTQSQRQAREVSRLFLHLLAEPRRHWHPPAGCTTTRTQPPLRSQEDYFSTSYIKPAEARQKVCRAPGASAGDAMNGHYAGGRSYGFMTLITILVFFAHDGRPGFSLQRFIGGSGPPRSSIGRFSSFVHVVARCEMLRCGSHRLPHSMSCPRLRRLREATQKMSLSG